MMLLSASKQWAMFLWIAFALLTHVSFTLKCSTDFTPLLEFLVCTRYLLNSIDKSKVHQVDERNGEGKNVVNHYKNHTNVCAD